jgi:hypothetical protein
VRGIISQPLFSEDARWNAERQPAEFGVEIEIGEDRGVVGVPRGACSSVPLPERPTPERCVEAYYLQRTRFENIVEAEIAASELLRVRVLAVTLAVLLVADEVLFLFGRDLVEQFTQKPLPAWLPAQVIGPFLAYEIVALLARPSAHGPEPVQLP